MAHMAAIAAVSTVTKTVCAVHRRVDGLEAAGLGIAGRGTGSAVAICWGQRPCLTATTLSSTSVLCRFGYNLKMNSSVMNQWFLKIHRVPYLSLSSAMPGWLSGAFAGPPVDSASCSACARRIVG